MIIVRLMGGLGNQLFQYALGRHLALRNNTDLKLDVSFYKRNATRIYLLKHFCIQARFAGIGDYLASGLLLKKIIRKYFPGLLPRLPGITLITEKDITFQPEILEARGDIYLEGYWQSEKYFLPIRDILQREFTLKSNITRQPELLRQIAETDAVAVHVRRGDYLGTAYGLCSAAYYQKALSLLAPKLAKMKVFLFTDDIPWVKAQLQLPYPHVVVSEQTHDVLEDFYLMRQCKHFVIANSSFSWWAAWLAEYPHKTVYAPQDWALAQGIMPVQDMIPESWRQLPAGD